MRKKRMRYILHEIKMGLAMVLWPLLWVCMFLMMNNKVGAPGVILALVMLIWNSLVLIKNM